LPPTNFLIQWFVTWVILGVVFYFAAEQIQRAIYETAVDRLAWRVLLVTPLLAAVLVKWPLPFQNIFFNMLVTLGHAVLWFLASWLALRFQWQHAAAAGLIAVVTIAPVTSSTVDSIRNRFLKETPTKTSAANEPRGLTVAYGEQGPLSNAARGVPLPGRAIGADAL